MLLKIRNINDIVSNILPKEGAGIPIVYAEQDANLYTKLYFATTPYLIKSFHIFNQ